MTGRLVAALMALTLAAPAMAAPPEAPPEPSSRPDWAVVRKIAEAALKQGLYDPEAAQITWDGGWRWGHVKPFQVWSKRSWGWLGCASLNGKNRMGGYVGATTRYVLLVPRPDNTWKVIANDDIVTSECDQPNPTPLQPEFIDAGAVTSGPSVADELVKLAGLLDKKLITQAEFDAQKAKLLAR